MNNPSSKKLIARIPDFKNVLHGNSTTRTFANFKECMEREYGLLYDNNHVLPYDYIVVDEIKFTIFQLKYGQYIQLIYEGYPIYKINRT